MIIRTPKVSASSDEDREQETALPDATTRYPPITAATPSNPRFTMFWPLNVIGRDGSSSCSLPNAIRLAVVVRKPEQHFEQQRAHREPVRLQAVVFRGADQRRSQRAASLRDRGSLRHMRHRHEHRERDTDRRADNQAGGDPFVIDHFMPQQRADHGQQHADFARDHAAPRRRRRGHPFQSKDKQRSGDEVKSLVDFKIHFFAGSRFLNILSMRSVIR